MKRTKAAWWWGLIRSVNDQHGLALVLFRGAALDIIREDYARRHPTLAEQLLLSGAVSGIDDDSPAVVQ